MIIVLLFALGGLALGFSLVFFFAPQQINKRNMLAVNVGKKVSNKGTEGLINKVVSIDEKITAVSTAMGVVLIVLTVILFWVGCTLM